MNEPVWMEKDEVLLIHDMQLAEHGGREGTRDIGLLESALARPKNLYAYEDTTLTHRAAGYAFGIVANHPFIDGNKRTALVVAFTFLELNGIAVSATQEEIFLTFSSLAQGERTETQVTDWLNDHSYRLE